MSTANEGQAELGIKDYANWVVKDARADCRALGLEVVIENPAPTPDKTEAAIVERNGKNSPPGGDIPQGGIVSLVIFPLEPRQR